MTANTNYAKIGIFYSFSSAFGSLLRFTADLLQLCLTCITSHHPITALYHTQLYVFILSKIDIAARRKRNWIELE